MAHIARRQVQVEINSPADKFYGFFRNKIHHLVQMFPENVKSLQLVEGVEMRAGSLLNVKYDLGSPMTGKKAKVDDIDDEDMSITFNIVQGDVLRLYKSFKVKLHVVEVRKGVSSAEWTMEFEKANANAPDPDQYMDFAVKISKGLDAHFCKS